MLADQPLRYELEPLGGVVQGKYQLGDSRFFAGIGYVYVAMDVRFEAPGTTPGLPDHASESTIGGLLPSLTFDTRDNIFTPTKGLYAEATLATFAEALGADDDYQRGTLLAMYYRPLGGKVYLGIKGQATATWSDPPFYLLPYVQLRGAPAMRYQCIARASCRTPCERRRAVDAWSGRRVGKVPPGRFGHRGSRGCIRAIASRR